MSAASVQYERQRPRGQVWVGFQARTSGGRALHQCLAISHSIVLTLIGIMALPSAANGMAIADQAPDVGAGAQATVLDNPKPFG
jgi:hypothetical protein